MIGALTLLLACQLAGEIVTRGLGLPIPGPVLGLAFLAAGLWIDAHRSGAPDDAVENTQIGRLAAVLLANLGLLFVPAGVGVVEQLPVLGDYGVAIVISLVVSTMMTLLVTVAVFLLAKRLVAKWRHNGSTTA